MITLETIPIRVEVHVMGKLRWSCRLPVTNNPKKMVDEAREIVPDRFRFIDYAEFQPRLGAIGPGEIVGRIIFYCKKDGL